MTFCQQDHVLHNLYAHDVQLGGGEKRKSDDQSSDQSVSSDQNSQNSRSRDRDVNRDVKKRRHRSPPALPIFTRLRTRKAFRNLIR